MKFNVSQIKKIATEARGNLNIKSYDGKENEIWIMWVN